MTVSRRALVLAAGVFAVLAATASPAVAEGPGGPITGSTSNGK